MSKTGDALEALFAALEAKACEPAAAIPSPLQNEELPSRLATVGADLQMMLNVWDDSDGEQDELLGADVVDEAYEITRDVPVEFVVAGGDRAARRAAFEAGLEAIDDAVAADRTLAGTVDYAHVLAPRRNGSGLSVDGLPNILAAEIRVRLVYTSSRSF
jgi:hypothetical protein